MRINNRLFLVALLVPTCFSVADVEAQERGSSAVKGGLWSDSSTWSGGAVPEAGDVVTIGAGLDVVLGWLRRFADEDPILWKPSRLLQQTVLPGAAGRGPFALPLQSKRLSAGP